MLGSVDVSLSKYGKTLAALAALAATASFAQSSVSIIGNFDVGYKAVSNSKNDTAKFGGFAGSNASTSAVIFKGVEDLGGGLKASFLAEIDHNPVQSTTANLAGNGMSQAYTGTPFNGEQYVGIEGAFGNLKLGTPNSPALTVGTMSTPFGTAMGGGWSSGFGRLGTAGVSGLSQFVGSGATPVGRIIRSEKAAVYTSPVFNGFNAQIEYSAGNANSGYASNDNSLTGLAANYNNGPLNLGYYYGKAAAGAAQAAGQANAVGTPVANSLAANTNVVWNILGANYTFGATTVYAGATTTKASDNSEDSKSWNLAAKYAVNAQIDLMANYLERTSNLASQNDSTHVPKAKLFGIGADYKLSKTTSLYARFEQQQGVNVSSNSATAAYVGSNTPTVAAAADATVKTTAVGLRVQF